MRVIISLEMKKKKEFTEKCGIKCNQKTQDYYAMEKRIFQ